MGNYTFHLSPLLDGDFPKDLDIHYTCLQMDSLKADALGKPNPAELQKSIEHQVPYQLLGV